MLWKVQTCFASKNLFSKSLSMTNSKINQSTGCFFKSGPFRFFDLFVPVVKKIARRTTGAYYIYFWLHFITTSCYSLSLSLSLTIYDFMLSQTISDYIWQSLTISHHLSLSSTFTHYHSLSLNISHYLLLLLFWNFLLMNDLITSRAICREAFAPKKGLQILWSKSVTIHA